MDIYLFDKIPCNISMCNLHGTCNNETLNCACEEGYYL